MFDRFSIYVRAVPGQSWKGDYWSTSTWIQVEPRRGNPESDPLSKLSEHDPAKQAPPKRVADTKHSNPSAAPFLKSK
jgi:hypothetical protein